MAFLVHLHSNVVLSCVVFISDVDSVRAFSLILVLERLQELFALSLVPAEVSNEEVIIIGVLDNSDNFGLCAPLEFDAQVLERSLRFSFLLTLVVPGELIFIVLKLLNLLYMLSNLSSVFIVEELVVSVSCFRVNARLGVAMDDVSVPDVIFWSSRVVLNSSFLLTAFACAGGHL